MKLIAFVVLISLALSSALTRLLIPLLSKINASNTERKLGVKEHLKKQGTPTMGGIAFVVTILIVSLTTYNGNMYRLGAVLILFLGFAVIGLIDDIKKVLLKQSDGLKPLQKFIAQIIVVLGFLIYVYNFVPSVLKIAIPFTKNSVNIGIFAIPLAFLCILGTVNGVNFTDGVDGLASNVTIIVALFFTFLTLKMNAHIEVITLATIGALIGFLIFNNYKASIFMGDTGSLALGGLVSGFAYMCQKPYIIIVVGFVYLMEVCSVIIQVLYFKKTHGKRIFKMTPIHHHFELSGYNESKIVSSFTILTIVLCLICLMFI